MNASSESGLCAQTISREVTGTIRAVANYEYSTAQPEKQVVYPMARLACLGNQFLQLLLEGLQGSLQFGELSVGAGHGTGAARHLQP
jgi:hypothetical protein